MPDLKYEIYLLGKAWFQYDMDYGDFEDLPRKTIAEKASHDNGFNIDKNSRYDGYQQSLASMVYELFDSKVASYADKYASRGAAKSEILQNKELAKELHKPYIRKFEKRKVHSSFIDNIWSAALADMQLLINSIKDLHFYNVLLIFLAKMHGLFLWKIRKVLQLLILFLEPCYKPKKYGETKAVNLQLIMVRNNDVEIYSSHNEEKSVL